MSRAPRTIGQFADVAAVLDTAIKMNGARYTLATPGQAVNWRQRAYTLRRLLQQQDAAAKAATPGATVTTKYDGIVLRLQENIVLIEVLKPTGILESNDGKVVTPEAETTFDPLLDEALDLIRDNEV